MSREDPLLRVEVGLERLDAPFARAAEQDSVAPRDMYRLSVSTA